MDLPPFPISRPEGTVMMVLQTLIEDDGNKVCGIKQLFGTIHAPPKAWVRAVREEVAKIEGLARQAGCNEMRICGRDWSRILPDYEECDGLTNGIRKRL
jgi:hypothetical protein